MDDRLDVVVLDQLGDQRLVADVADDRQHRRGQRGGKSGGQVVEHDDALAGIDQRVHGMASDIACAAGDQHGHGFLPSFAQKPYRGARIEPVIAGRWSPDKWPACLMPGIRSRDQFERILMPDVLFIKTSSLGDVIHHMPALTEARARRPDARFAWVVEEAFAPLVRLHPAVGEVIPVAARQLAPRAVAGLDLAARSGNFLRVLRARAYDQSIDTQGLFLKSALIARAARGRRHGYDPNSIKEAFACALYDVRHAVEWNQHAIARNRALTGLALGYTPDGPPDFGLDRAALAGPAAAPYGVLLHATARADKEWPEANWRMLAAALGTSIDLVVPFGTEAERERAIADRRGDTARARAGSRAARSRWRG